MLDSWKAEIEKIIFLMPAFYMIAVFTTGGNTRSDTNTASSIIISQIGDTVITADEAEIEIDKKKGNVQHRFMEQ